MPTLFETFATSGEKPSPTSVGKVTSEPDPTTALIIPANAPAPAIASTPSQLSVCTLEHPRQTRTARRFRTPAVLGSRHPHVSETSRRGSRGATAYTSADAGSDFPLFPVPSAVV